MNDTGSSRPIRVLHVISAPAAGGAEMYVKDLTIELRRQGHEPFIAFVGRAAEGGRSTEFERHFLSELTAAGIPYSFLGHECRRNPLLGSLRIRRLCQSLDIDAYHSHLKYGILFGLLLRAIPRLHTHHSSVPNAPLWAYKFFNRLVDEYVGISEECARLLTTFTGRTPTVIRNGINIARFRRRVRRLEAAGTVQCICVGRIFRPKNYPLLVEAMGLLPGAIRDGLCVSIVGEGPADEVEELKQAIHAAGLGAHVRLLGNRRDIPELLDRSEIMVMSSAWEGFPIALLEATAAGLPFIATDVGGCREIADLYGNGLIVEAGNPNALAQAIESLLTSPEQAELLSKAAIDSAPKLSIVVAAEAHGRLYRQLIAAALAAGRGGLRARGSTVQ